MLLTRGTRRPFAAAGLRADEYAEVRRERTRLLTAVWRGGALESVNRVVDEGGCARVLSPRGSSFVCATEADLDDVLRRARHQADRLGAAPVRPADREPARGSHAPAVPEPATDVPLDEQLDLLAGWHARALNAHPDISGALVYYRHATTTVDLATSDGGEVSWTRADLTLQITLYAGAGDTRGAGSVSVGSHGDFAAVRDLAARIDEAAATAVDLARAPALEAGSYDVVCDGPLAATWAHETVGHLAEADHQQGAPAAIEALRPGRRLGPEELTIVDRPGPPTARGHVPVDDECTTGREVTLIDRGRVGTPRLHDLRTAAAFHEAPTGNARALNYRHPPLPRLRTTCVEAGTSTLEEMIQGVRSGLLAQGLFGGQTNRSGFAFLPAACRVIRDGEVRGLVKGAVLTGAVLDTFATVDAVGREVWRGDTSASCGKQGQTPLPVSCWAPALRLRGLHVDAG